MTARELATLLRARKCGKGKWVAKCVAHPDRTPSLSIREGRKGVMLKCMSQGCSLKDICGALGITVESLFYDSGKATPEIKGRLADERKLEALGARRTSILFLLGWDSANSSYWEGALRRIHEEMGPLYWKLMPDQDRFEKVRRFEVEDYRNRRLDWLRGKA